MNADSKISKLARQVGRHVQGGTMKVQIMEWVVSGGGGELQGRFLCKRRTGKGSCLSCTCLLLLLYWLVHLGMQ